MNAHNAKYKDRHGARRRHTSHACPVHTGGEVWSAQPSCGESTDLVAGECCRGCAKAWDRSMNRA
eukprot:1433914-Prymnesium_polylepis.2